MYATTFFPSSFCSSLLTSPLGDFPSRVVILPVPQVCFQRRCHGWRLPLQTSKGLFRSFLKVNYLLCFTTDLKSFVIGSADFYFYFSERKEGHGQGNYLAVVKPADNSTSIVVLSVYSCTQQR